MKKSSQHKIKSHPINTTKQLLVKRGFLNNNRQSLICECDHVGSEQTLQPLST